MEVYNTQAWYNFDRACLTRQAGCFGPTCWQVLGGFGPNWRARCGTSQQFNHKMVPRYTYKKINLAYKITLDVTK